MINHWCQHPYMLPQEIVWKWVPASNNPPSSSLFVAAVRWLLPILPPVALELHGSKTSFGTWHGVPSIRCSFFLCWPSRKHTTTYWNPFLPTSSLHVMFQICWLVVLTILKTISQWEGLSHILWKKNMFQTTNQFGFASWYPKLIESSIPSSPVILHWGNHRKT